MKHRHGSAAAQALEFDKKRVQCYTLTELLRGVTPAVMAKLTADIAWAREGEPVGRKRA